MRDDPAVAATSTADEAPAAAPTKARLLQSGIAYTLPSVLSRGVSFLLLPVFTHILSPSDYGQLSVALSVNAVASIVFALGFETTLFRGFFQLSDRDARTRFLLSAWTFLTVASVVMALLCVAVLAPFLGSSDVLSAERLALSLLVAVMSVASTTVPLVVLRAENRIRDYLVVTVALAVSSTLLTVALVVWIRSGVVGWLWSLIASYAIAFALTIRLVPYGLPRPFDFDGIRRTLRISLPVVPHFAAMWALQLADRSLVAGMLSTSAAGVYSLASNLALPMYMVIIGFGQAFMPSYARAGKAEGSDGSLRQTIALQVGLAAIFCVACALLAPPAVHLLTNRRYASAAPLVPWLVLGYGFLALYAIPMNGVTLTHGRTKGLVVVSGTGAATNIGLIVALGPVYGIEAVAIASAVGYAVLLVGVLVFARWTRATLRYPWRRIGAALALGAIGYSGAALTTGDTSAMNVAVRLVWIVATAAAVGAVTLGPATLLRTVSQRLGMR